MEHNEGSPGLEAMTMLLSSYGDPGPACADALELRSTEDWTPGAAPWLNAAETARHEALDAVRRAYREASEGLDTEAAAELARQMTAGAGDHMRRLYLAAATRPARHQESFSHLMTLAAEMHAEEIALANESIALALAEGRPDSMAFAVGMLRRRIRHAEDARRTGDAIYTDSTETGLASRIEEATHQRGRLLAGDMEDEMRRRLPGHLGNRPGLRLWDLYGHPAAVAVYAESRNGLDLEADRGTVDRMVAALPWPTPISRYSWSPRQILHELLWLHQRSAERAQPWDGTIDFSD